MTLFRLSRRAVLAGATFSALPAFAQGETPTIAAAASLNFVLPALAADFARRTGRQVTPVFGSSGNLARQIVQGAPHQLFLSADEAFVRTLIDAGKADGAGAVYALGRLALYAARSSPVRVDGRLSGLRAAVRAGRVTRFAIANPETAPYGRAAIEVLQRSHLWALLEGRLVFGENVAQAAQFASSGAAQAGLVAASLVAAPDVAALGRSALIDAQWHGPLTHKMLLVRGAGETARAFYAYLLTQPARTLFRRWGFTAPA